MGVCVPIRDMKNTAEFSRLVENSADPVTVTKNGYDAFVVMRSGDYAAMRDEVAKAKLMRVLSRAEDDYERGRCASGSDFVAGMREKYGL